MRLDSGSAAMAAKEGQDRSAVLELVCAMGCALAVRPGLQFEAAGLSEERRLEVRGGVMSPDGRPCLA